MEAGTSGHLRGQSKRPGLRGPGPGCKSPAGRRRGDGEGSAGRSAASPDGRRALIARSQDLPCPSCLDAAREPPEYTVREPEDWRARDGARTGCGGFPIAAPPGRSATIRPAPHRGRPTIGRGAATGNGGGRPPFSFPSRLPRSGPASPTLVRSARRHFSPKRPIASRVRREAIDGWRCANGMSPVWTRSGSRPINHGCSVRDSRTGSPLPTLRQLRSLSGCP